MYYLSTKMQFLDDISLISANEKFAPNEKFAIKVFFELNITHFQFSG